MKTRLLPVLSALVLLTAAATFPRQAAAQCPKPLVLNFYPNTCYGSYLSTDGGNQWMAKKNIPFNGMSGGVAFSIQGIGYIVTGQNTTGDNTGTWAYDTLRD